MNFELIANVITGLAVIDAIAATRAIAPAFGIPIGSEQEVLDVILPTDLSSTSDPREQLIGSDLYGSSPTFATWRSRTKIVYATPWLWSVNGIGASPVTSWIEVEPGTNQTTFRSRRVARIWPLLLIAAICAHVARFESTELLAFSALVPLAFMLIFIYRPAARVAAGMYHEITANLIRSYKRDSGPPSS